MIVYNLVRQSSQINVANDVVVDWLNSDHFAREREHRSTN